MAHVHVPTAITRVELVVKNVQQDNLVNTLTHLEHINVRVITQLILVDPQVTVCHVQVPAQNASMVHVHVAIASSCVPALVVQHVQLVYQTRKQPAYPEHVLFRAMQDMLIAMVHASKL
jgi:hypothetical protein